MSGEHKVRYSLSALAWLAAALCAICLSASAVSVAAQTRASATFIDGAGLK